MSKHAIVKRKTTGEFLHMKKEHLIKTVLLTFTILVMAACGKPAGVSDDDVKKDFIAYMKDEELQEVEVESMDIKTEKEDADFVIKSINVDFSTNSVDYERQYVASYEKEDGNWSLINCHRTLVTLVVS